METNLIGQISTPKVMAEIRIQLVQQDGGIGISVSSSADPISTLGLLEMAKDSFRGQSQKVQSPLIVAHGAVPRP